MCSPPSADGNYRRLDTTNISSVMGIEDRFPSRSSPRVLFMSDFAVVYGSASITMLWSRPQNTMTASKTITDRRDRSTSPLGHGGGPLARAQRI